MPIYTQSSSRNAIKYEIDLISKLNVGVFFKDAHSDFVNSKLLQQTLTKFSSTI